MSKADFTKTLAAALLLLVAPAQASAQRGPKPVVTRQFQPESARDAELEAAIRDPDGDGEPDNYDPSGESWTNYYYNRVDLDGDGRPEVLVYLFGSYMCGSGGCNTLVFRRAGGRYKLVADIALTRNPVFVSERRTNGWNDLVVPVAGGGIRGHYAVLRFDGRSYPDNATGDTATPLRAPVRARAYLVGGGGRETGFAL
ncbi:MAG: hypothetical protein ABW250_24125 [Pyrinomonadaceae bacterium]